MTNLSLPALPDNRSVAIAILLKTRYTVSRLNFRDAAVMMNKTLAPEVLSYLDALNGATYDRLSPDLVDWLQSLAVAIIGEGAPQLCEKKELTGA